MRGRTPTDSPNNITIVTRVNATTQAAIKTYADRRKLPFATAVRDILQRALKITTDVAEKK